MEFMDGICRTCGTEWCPHCDNETDFDIEFPLNKLVCEENVMIRCEHCGELQHPCSICEGCDGKVPCLDQILEGLGYTFEHVEMLGEYFCKITGYMD